MMGERELGVILFGVGVVVALFLVIRRALHRNQMPLTYLDQNALIELGVKARRADFRPKLDKAHGGSIDVQSSVGEGSAFRVRLRMTKA